MGFLDFVEFALKCFDVLAWPLFALVYPLYSSIRAIETNSITDTQKINTYWVVFSLILLFEHAFMKILQWFPVWLYIRLLIVFWLVIPHFDGAFYVYKNLICPLLSMDPQIVINWFDKRKESVTREIFLSEVERYVKDNGSDDLEKIVACKPKSIKPNGGQKDIKAVQVLEKTKDTTANHVSQAESNLTVVKDRFPALEINEKTIEVAAHSEIVKTPSPKKVSPLPTQSDTSYSSPSPLSSDKHRSADESLKIKNEKELKLTWTEKSTVAGVENQEKPVEVTGREDLEAPKEVQKEWTCALCQVTTTCETNLKTHLKGRKHKAAYETLKSMNQAFVPKLIAASTPKKSNQLNEEPAKSTPSSGSKQKATANDTAQGQKYSNAASIAKTLYKPKGDLAEGVSSNGQKKKIIAVNVNEVVVQTQQQKKNEVPRIKGSPVWCKICNVRCCSEIDMASHLKGQRHKENVQEQQENPNKVAKKKLPPIWCEICDVYTSEFDIASHLHGRYHSDCLSSVGNGM